MEKLEACIKDKAVPDANNAALIIKHLLNAAALCLYVILQQSLRCVEELRKEKKGQNRTSRGNMKDPYTSRHMIHFEEKKGKRRGEIT